MNIDDLIPKMEQSVIAFESERVDLALGSAFAFIALFKRRVLNDRVNAEGNIFGIYADSTWAQKKRKDSGDRRIQFREEDIMLRNVRPILANINIDQVTTELKTTPDRQEIFTLLDDKHQIAKLNKEEKDLVLDAYYKELNDFLNKSWN